MKWATLLYALFIGAGLALAMAAAVMLRSAAPAEAGMIERFVSPGRLSSAHQAFAAECTACHTPLKGVETKTCIGCHAATDFGSKQSTLFHARATQCTSCHVEHDGARSLARMDHEVLSDPGLWKPVSRPSDRIAAKSLPVPRLDCAGCHSYRDPHLGLFGRDCASCHSTDAWRIASYRHPSTNSKNCAECHRAPPSHYMEHFSMVSQRAAHEKARVEQCFACHTTDSFNNIRRRGWYDHH